MRPRFRIEVIEWEKGLIPHRVFSQVILQGDVPVLPPFVLDGIINKGWLLKSEQIEEGPEVVFVEEPVDWRTIADGLATALGSLLPRVDERVLDAYLMGKMAESMFDGLDVPEEGDVG